MKKTIALLAFTLAGTQIASAVLTLDINSVDKTFAFTGSVEVTPNDSNYVRWITTSTPVTPTAFSRITYSNNVAFSTSVGTPGSAFSIDDVDTQIESSTSSGPQFRIVLGVSDSGTQTLTGTGAYQSYAGLSSSAQASFESLIGTSVPVNQGTAVSDLTVTGTVVPEPSTALLGGLGLLLMLRRKR